MTETAPKPDGPDDDSDIEIPENIPPVLLSISVMYGVLLAIGGVWVLLDERQLIESTTPSQMTLELLSGIGTSLFMICVIGLAWKFTRVFRHVEVALSERLAEITGKGVLWLALLSSVAEEILFRGALLPQTINWFGPAGGLIVTSCLFGILHTGQNWKHLSWTIFAILAGFVLGGAYLWSNNILLPIVMHFIINAVNMWLIITRRSWHDYQAGLLSDA